MGDQVFKVSGLMFMEDEVDRMFKGCEGSQMLKIRVA